MGSEMCIRDRVKGRLARGVVLSRHRPSSAREISRTVYCNRLDIEPGDLFRVPPASSSDKHNQEASGKDPDPQKPLF